MFRFQRESYLTGKQPTAIVSDADPSFKKRLGMYMQQLLVQIRSRLTIHVDCTGWGGRSLSNNHGPRNYSNPATCTVLHSFFYHRTWKMKDTFQFSVSQKQEGSVQWVQNPLHDKVDKRYSSSWIWSSEEKGMIFRGKRNALEHQHEGWSDPPNVDEMRAPHIQTQQ